MVGYGDSRMGLVTAAKAAREGRDGSTGNTTEIHGNRFWAGGRRLDHERDRGLLGAGARSAGGKRGGRTPAGGPVGLAAGRGAPPALLQQDLPRRRRGLRTGVDGAGGHRFG